MKIYPVREWVIGEVVAEKAAPHGERTFVPFEDRRNSVRDLDVLSSRLAHVSGSVRECPGRLKTESRP